MRIQRLFRYLFPADYTGPPPSPPDRGAGSYPFRNAGDLTRPPGPLDAEGVVLMRYPGIGDQYNPIAVAQYALGAYDVWLERRYEALRRAFLAQVAWIRRAARPGPGGGAYWYHDFDNPYYPLRGPWPSAMAQGQIISVLVRAAALEPARADETLDLARAGLVPFTIPVAEGGVLAGAESDPWYEEYPTEVPSRVLNGFIFSLWGLGDLVEATHDRQATWLLEAGLAALARHAIEYDLGYWTRYGTGLLETRPTSPFYHRIHIAQMRIMSESAGDGAYGPAASHRGLYVDLARRWQGYWTDPAARVRALAGIAVGKRPSRSSLRTSHA